LRLWLIILACTRRDRLDLISALARGIDRIRAYMYMCTSIYSSHHNRKRRQCEDYYYHHKHVIHIITSELII
jgi:hypothetical protein